MAAITTVRVKVPSKQSLEFLMDHWNKIKAPVLDGEFTVPDAKDRMTVNMSRVSHAITNIRTETFDPNTSTVAVDVVFTGPMSQPAIDEYVKGDIRFMPRCVRVRPPGGSDKDVFESIITWDLAHRPKDPDGILDKQVKKELAKMRKEENAKDKATELAKKKIKK